VVNISMQTDDLRHQRGVVANTRICGNLNDSNHGHKRFINNAATTLATWMAATQNQMCNSFTKKCELRPEM